MMATPFEDIQKPYEVGLDVGIGIGQRVADSGLGGEIHSLRLVLGEHRLYEFAILDPRAHLDEVRILPSPLLFEASGSGVQQLMPDARSAVLEKRQDVIAQLGFGERTYLRRSDLNQKFS